MQNKYKNKLIRIENYDIKMVDRSITDQIRPFIFSNKSKPWSAINLWTPTFFKEKYGRSEFNVTLNLPKETCPYLYDAKQYRRFMKLSDFIDLLSENNNCYLAQEDMHVFQSLEKDYNFYDLIPSSSTNHSISANLWIGSNTRSGLHFDHYDNFLAQIYGIKKVILIPPNDAAYLYPIPGNFFKSPINPMKPELNKFPKFKKARIFEGELRVGDVLFIPKGWYHYIYSPNQSISLNCWYGPPQSPKELLLTFYRSGWRVWAMTIKDFICHGILSRSFETKLYSSPPIGKVVYDFVKKNLIKI